VILTKLIRPLIRWAAVAAGVLLVVLGMLWVAGRIMISRAETETLATLPDGVPGRLVMVGDRPVHVVEQGDGSPVVLVHGLAGNTTEWEDTILEPLAAEHRTIAVELFGMGFSARLADGAYDYQTWVDQLVGVLDGLGITRADFVGHSLGAAVVSLLAAEHPERVNRLVLVAPLVPLTDEETAWPIRALEIPGVGEAGLGWIELADHPAMSERYRARSRQAFRIAGTRDALLRYVRDGEDFARLYDAYPRIQAPVLIIAGTDDDMVPWAAVRRAAPRIHDVTVLPLDSGHFPHRKHTARTVAAIQEFLGAPADE
jgi:pimeloyl-ACP methyl ester carboxylesterase